MNSLKNNSKFSLKFLLALALGLLVRLIPFRAPNIEPILATSMPMAQAYGAFSGFFFGVLSILLYDLITGTLGLQTFFTAGAYGVLGLFAASYFKKRNTGRWGYVRFAVFGTLFYDAVTGLTVGPIFFHQSFFGSLLGQIPFTLLHLAGNTTFAFFLSPVIYRLLVQPKKRTEAISYFKILNPKII